MAAKVMATTFVSLLAILGAISNHPEVKTVCDREAFDASQQHVTMLSAPIYIGTTVAAVSKFLIGLTSGLSLLLSAPASSASFMLSVCACLAALALVRIVVAVLGKPRVYC